MKKLLVVDLQKQFQDEGSVQYNKCLSFVKESMSKFDHTVATLFKQSKNNMNYVRHLQYLLSTGMVRLSCQSILVKMMKLRLLAVILMLVCLHFVSNCGIWV